MCIIILKIVVVGIVFFKSGCSQFPNARLFGKVGLKTFRGP